MAETITGSRPLESGFEDLEKKNKEVAQKLESQGKETATPKPEELAATGDALDALAATKNPDAKPEEGQEPPVVEPAATEPTPEQKVEAEKKAAEEKAAADAKTALESKANDLFKDSPQLSERASPKSAEAFSAIKIKAAQEISARESKIEELSKKVAEFEEKLKNPIPPELEKEVTALREFQAKMDVNFDPKFKQYDAKIESTRDFIYAQLKKSPAIPEKTIAEIKSIGGPELVNMTKVFEAIKDPTMQRIIESKIADIENIKYEKEQAVSQAKTNVSEYMAQREKQFSEAVNQHNTLTKQHLDSMVGQLPWFKDRQAKPDGTDKAEVEDHNKFVATTRQQLEQASQDDTPQMRAILLTGMVQLFNVQREAASLKAQLAASQKNLAEITKKWEAVRNAGVSRIRESQAPAGKTALPEKKDGVNTDTSGSLDALARQVIETRQAAGK